MRNLIRWLTLQPKSSSTWNADHKDALVLLARKFAGIEAHQAAITSIDRLTFTCGSKPQKAYAESGLLFCTKLEAGQRLEKYWWRWHNGHGA